MSDLFGGEPMRIAHTQLGANLRRAFHTKDDEFYTFETTIDDEVKKHEGGFEGKIIYCNCDREWSAFPKYFKDNQSALGVKEVIAHPGPFQSNESIELLKRCDMVVTNPPFAPFTEFMRQIRGRGKEFLVIGSVMKGSTKSLFPLIQRGGARVGYTRVKKFKRPDGSIAQVGCQWYTTLPVQREPIDLKHKYDPELYPTYDNWGGCINVDETERIPSDYDGLMGVPITFLEKHDPRQFDLLGAAITWDVFPDELLLNGRMTAQRLIIKHAWANPEIPFKNLQDSLL